MRPADRTDAWDQAPSGLLTLDPDGTVLDANTTFLSWVGREAGDVVGRRRLSELLSVGGRIYWETHLSPMLHAEGRVEEVAVELTAPGGRLPVLLTAVVDPGPPGATVHVALSSARERSRYERELLAARKDADRSATQTRVLQHVTAALSRAVGVDGIASAVLSAIGPLGASAATLWLRGPHGQLTVHSASGEEASDRPPATTSPAAAAPEGDRVVVPLHGQSSLRGVLSLLPLADPGAEPPDLDVLTAVGQQTGLALDRAALYEQSATVAHQLQQSLLATQVPQDERFGIATAYQPGVVSLEVGGDWYDAFLVEPDVLAVLVGDVVGRGLGAASAMGQLRSAVRAIAGPGVGPAALVSRLDQFVQQVEGAAFTTLAYSEVHLPTGRARYVCAGHMPPLLLPAGEEPRLAWEGRSTPLGLVSPGRPREEAELHLRPGDQVLLYTDGLVERRDRPLADGFAALRSTAAAARGTAPADAVDSIVAQLVAYEQGHDDVCALLLSWHGAHPR